MGSWYMGSRDHGIKGAWDQGIKGSWDYGCMGSRDHGVMESEVRHLVAKLIEFFIFSNSQFPALNYYHMTNTLLTKLH
jgi:hypothetical protein